MITDAVRCGMAWAPQILSYGLCRRLALDDVFVSAPLHEIGYCDETGY